MSAALTTVSRKLRLPGRHHLLPIAIVGLLSVWYLRFTPDVADLAAQVARAQAARDGFASWWTGWFGGLSTPDYSVLAPRIMSVVGVQGAGILACVGATVAGTSLMRSSSRPRTAAVSLAAFVTADVFAGRLTFALGVAAAIPALVALRSGRTVLSTGLAIGTYLLSPLAGLFLGIAYLASIIGASRLRRSSAVGAVALLGLGLGTALAFPGTGTQPFYILDAIPCLLSAAMIAVYCRTPVVRVGALLVIAGTVMALIVPSAIGSNMTRIAWLLAVPVFIADGNLTRRRLAATVAALSVWPTVGLGTQLAAATDRSTQATFYRPLMAWLADERDAAGGRSLGNRVEVTDTATHWPSTYLASFPLARGWDRQADHAYNPLFYEKGALTASSYEEWLKQLAVAWVVVPKAPLDYASRAEAALVTRGLSYLRPAWTSNDWKVYRVVQPSPLIDAATVVGVDADRVTLDADHAGTLRTRIRWSQYLDVLDASTAESLDGAAMNDNGWLTVDVPRSGRFIVTSRFRL